MAEQPLTARNLEHALRESGLSCRQAKRAIFHMRQAGFLEVMTPKAEPEKSGLLHKLKTALSGK